jgi:hypothetical protein
MSGCSSDFTNLLSGSKEFPLDDKPVYDASDYFSEAEILDIISEFYIETLHLNPVRIVFGPTEKSYDFESTKGFYQTFSVWNAYGEKGTEIRIDLTTGAIVSYRNPNAIHPYAPSELLGHSVTMTSTDVAFALETGIIEPLLNTDEMFGKCRPVLRRFGLSLDRNEYTILDPASDEFLSTGIRTNRDFFNRVEEEFYEQNHLWSIRDDLDFKGVPVANKSVAIMISQKTGRIFRVHYEPIVYFPDPVETMIDKSEALAIAVESMKKNDSYNRYDVEKYDVPLEDVSQEIVFPYPDMDRSSSEKRAIEKLPPLEPRYTWKVKFYLKPAPRKNEWLFNDREVTIHIDVETGQVIR